MGFFSRKKNKDTSAPLSKIKKPFQWKKLFFGDKLNDEFFNNLEESLIKADAGGKNTLAIMEALQKQIETEKLSEPGSVKAALRAILKTYFVDESFQPVENKLQVLVVIGINGVGKTTSIAKICHHFIKNGKSVSLGAADTFRAAAKEQLEEWATRLNVNITSADAGSDPASVAYDSVHSALAKEKDLVVIDTAGRLHNKGSLVDQLGKLFRVLGKFEDKIDIKSLLVLDSTLGLSGFEQVKSFQEKVPVDGLLLSKTDTQAKGGILISIASALKVPVWFVGFGEQKEDIKAFDIEEYLNSILGED